MSRGAERILASYRERPKQTPQQKRARRLLRSILHPAKVVSGRQRPIRPTVKQHE